MQLEAVEVLVVAGFQILQQGDPHLFAIALSGMMIQVTRDWLQSQDETPLTERTQFVIDLFFDGARPVTRKCA